MTIVAVVIYNRIANLKKWLNCWRQCDKTDAELIIIHNYYGNETEKAKFKTICEQNNVRYVPRNKQGADIGALQDVCLERLAGFPVDWDYLLWCTDDCLPMATDFVKPFVETLQDKCNGVSCMQISKSNPGGVWHVRTTGFCISKQMSKQLRWPADPILTKQHCYAFEHRGGAITISEQIRIMGLNCIQVAPVATSPLWDSLHPNLNLRLDRQQEFNQVWGIKEHIPKVLFICPIYNMFPQVISSLQCQTYTNWELLLIHNGPLNDHIYDIPDDNRIKFTIHPVATGKWGHELRRKALIDVRDRDDIDYIVITNADNYYTPVFTEYLMKGFKKNKNAVASYCSEMVHSYKAWQILPVRLQQGFIDCGGVMVKKDVACEVGWRNTEDHSSDWIYFQDIAAKYNRNNFVSVRGCLFVHN